MANIAPVDASDIYKTIKILVEQGIERRDHVNQFLRSIYRVPKTLRDVSDKCYTPRIVSIGPFHHEEENLKGVEVQKMTYMLDLFRRFNSPWEQTWKVCLDLVQDKIVQIRACYEGEMMKTYDDHVFAQMMVVDACFIIELINRSNHPNYKSRSFVDNKLLTLYVKHDLLLLENQIPFFVLDDIFECTIRKFKRRSCLTKLILTFLKDMNPFGTDLPLDNDEEDNNDHDHILGLFQKCYWGSHAMPSVLSKTPLKLAEEFSKAISYSVTELALAGVKFKPNRDPKRVLEMKFKSSRSPCFCWSWGKPTFRMPKLVIEDYTESVLRNLIVYEQFSPTIPDYITSYAFAMERILDTKEDIVKVIESKVLVNNLGSSEQASNMMNSICKEVTVKDFLYIDQWKQLEAYYNGYWPRNITWLRRTYFNTPWSFIALLAALFLFCLTVAQTYYTIRPPA